MKVHFAGNREHSGNGLLMAGVRYRLESFYDITERNKCDGAEIWNQYNHTIIDSGLFTLMFGSEKAKGINEEFCEAWLNKYVEFINSTPFKNASFVELDVQKKISSDYAWDLRQRMKARINKGTVINVFHLEDGSPDRIIDYADYMAVSLPELRFSVSDRERYQITRYIAEKMANKGKKVHLLGCTELKYLKDFSYCYSCDSTSWQASFRYGASKTKTFGNVHINQIRNNEKFDRKAVNDIYWSALFALQDYKRYAGDQG